MAVDQTRYRQLQFEGARILESREMNWLQEMAQGVALESGGGGGNQVSGMLASLYRQGATKNIQVGIVGLTATLSAINGSLPMEIFVRDRWETFPAINDDCTGTGGTVAGNAPMTLNPTTDTAIFLNWELRQRTGGLGGDDPSLIDPTTNEATANAGELILHLSNVDTSGVPLSPSQLAKNVSPIQLFVFTNSGTLLTLVPQDNVISSALANQNTSGFVKTSTSDATVVSINDPSVTNARPAAINSVSDPEVVTPIADGGTNAAPFSTPTYQLPEVAGRPNTGVGGISAAKILLVATMQTLEAGWNAFVGLFNSLLAAFNAHATAALGLANTHPIPTAAQVGAAPISHVGQPLGLVTSHPAVTNVGTGGFRVNRGVVGPGAVGDPAYGIFDSLNTDLASLNHSGDVYASLAQALTVSGVSAPATTTGALGLMSTIAKVLSQHVNQNAASGHFNPHNTTVASLNAAISLSSQSVSNGTVGHNNTSGKYVILTFNNGGTPITVAVGIGTAFSKNSGGDFGAGTNFTIPLPTGGFTTANTISGISLLQNYTDNESYGTGSRYQFWATRSNFVSGLTYNMTSWKIDSDGSARPDCDASATWYCVAWIG